MKVLSYSDTHLEFYTTMRDITIHGKKLFNTEQRDITIFAGDITTKQQTELFEVFTLHHLQYSDIYYVLGNHEYWHCPDLKSAYDKFDEIVTYINTLAEERNLIYRIHLLQNENSIVTLADKELVLVGSTMWTDYNKNNPIAKITGKTYMADFNRIGVEHYSSWISGTFPDELYDCHQTMRSKIVEAGQIAKKLNYQLVVISHHGCSSLSLDERYITSGQENYSYVSDMSDLMFSTDEYRAPSLWVHGHVHKLRTYTIGETRVFVNPTGYKSERNGYTGSFVIEI